MKDYLLILLTITLLLTSSSAQLTQRTTFELHDYSYLDDYLYTTANGRYLIQVGDQIDYIFDLDDGSYTSAGTNSIIEITPIPGTDQILQIQSSDAIRKVNLPNLDNEEFNLSANLDISINAYKFFNDDGTILYLIDNDEMQYIDFSNDSYTVSDLKTISVCDNLINDSLSYFPCPQEETVTLVNNSNVICILEYDNWENFQAIQGSHTDTIGDHISNGLLLGRQQIVQSETSQSDALLYSIVDEELLFTYTLRQDGALGFEMSKYGTYWMAMLNQGDFFVGNTQGRCRYSITNPIFNTQDNDYDFFIDVNTLIIIENDQTVYAFDIGSNWQQIDDCTLTYGVLPEIQSNEIENSSVVLIQFSALALLLILSVF